MGVYSIKGSDVFDARLNKDFGIISRALSELPDGNAFRALVLIGGYGRGEGTPYIVDGRELPFNDYDFVVVSGPMTRGRRASVQSSLRLLEQRLTKDVGLPVDLCLYPDDVLRHAEFSMLNYEMKYGHKVVWGDDRILDRMPEYARDRIPMSEGTRLLLNRGKLLLDVRRALRDGRTLSADERLRFVKFVFKALLAFGDCTLLLHGDYDISYAVKKDRIGRYAASNMPDPGFMIESYRRAIALKEWGDYSFLKDYDWVDEYEGVRRYYILYFQWYESSRLCGEVGTSAAYARALAHGPRECHGLKALVLNAQTFGARACQWGAAMLRTHPRARLYLALPILLGDETADPALLSQILGTPTPDVDAAERRFYELQRRFS